MAVELRVRLKEVLKERGMTQKELAALTSLRENTISEVANNTRKTIDRTVIAIIADALNIKDLNELLHIQE
ncbi:helix-turn-helix transcriptional regulator [Brevibacillus borstelensis]|nr:helix-turn-helix transcriptional regulator [Brevibacillus borstelensis]WNF06366.1 helix-turn-helix transcriptional regulator [Brevibacillus borstelensis]